MAEDEEQGCRGESHDEAAGLHAAIAEGSCEPRCRLFLLYAPPLKSD
jgi:hypothetical protein